MERKRSGEEVEEWTTVCDLHRSTEHDEPTQYKYGYERCSAGG